ncbi:uncharacterized protein LOC117639164 [Thrips palmi]|uniref:Uncharacterized protein LOC117639164 n=1 Tax=Thrips palmi TaxID=161013 RepID=A0A6P8Y9K5_THRPL|nr:uncharacterized protein LOC117639164 [Thrips palmi]
MLIPMGTMSLPARLVQLLLATTIVMIIKCTAQMQIAGPFRVVPGYMEDCPPEMRPKTEFFKGYYSGFRDRRNTDVWYYSGNITTFITADDNYTATFNLASWSSRGGWKDNAFQKSTSRLCTTIKTFFPNVWRKGMMMVFNDPTRDCPFPPQDTYSVNNVSTNYIAKFPPSFFYGRYRGTGQILNTETKELIACKRCYFQVVPKQQNSATP